MEDARETLSGALAIFERAPDADPWDRIKLLKTRGALCARQGDWNAAEQDLGKALSIADRESRADPVVLRPLLIDYAAATPRYGRSAHRIAVGTMLQLDRDETLKRNGAGLGNV